MQWLNTIFEQILSIFPRLQQINPDEAGVRITCGKRYRPTPPGLYLYWPLIQEIIRIDTALQVIDLRPQSILTADGVDFLVSGAVAYRITDAVKAILEVQDFDKSLVALALGVISGYIHGKSYNDCKDSNGLRGELLKQLREAARGWGIKIADVYITDSGTVKNIRVLGNESIMTLVTDKGE